MTEEKRFNRQYNIMAAVGIGTPPLIMGISFLLGIDISEDMMVFGYISTGGLAVYILHKIFEWREKERQKEDMARQERISRKTTRHTKKT